MRKRITLITAGSLATLCTAGALVLATSASAHYSALVHRPHVRAGSLTANTVTTVIPTVVQQFQTPNNSGWCVGAPNPCDGNVNNGDYGTIDSGVASGFSNGGYGNYAPATSALFKSKMALISGSSQANQSLGCQTPGTEGCTGPYYLPPATESVFPTNGFTVTDDIYLDPAATVGNAAEIDPDVAIADSSGGYGQDMIFAVCNQGGGTGYSVTFGHNSPGNCSGAPVITTAGWYRFVWLFTDVGGYGYLTQKVFAESSPGTPVADSRPQPIIFGSDTGAEPISTLGGVSYVWFPTLQVEGMPMGNFAIQQGQHPTGHTP
jgi:hypothetical protein